MSTKEKTCAELVREQMASREADIKALMSDPESDWSDEPALSIETSKVTIVTLSWGGPADYLEIAHNDNGINKVIYRYSDWFDTATAEVERGSYLWDYANYILDIIEA